MFKPFMYRVHINSDELNYIFVNSHVIMFTETWANDMVDLNVNGFTYFNVNRLEKKIGSKRDSGGIIIYVRNSFITPDILFKKDEDDIIWLKLQGSLLNLQYDLYLCLCYVFTIGTSRGTMVQSNIFDRILTFMAEIDSKTNGMCNFMICGDFNARTSNDPDFVLHDTADHINVLPDDYIIDSPLHVLPKTK